MGEVGDVRALSGSTLDRSWDRIFKVEHRAD